MRARTASSMPRDGALARLKAGLHALALRADPLIDHLPRTSAFTRALVVCAAAVAFVAALTYYGADEFSRRAVDQRAAAEATSLATLTGRLATGDAYQSYLEMLRYADDPRVHNRATAADARRTAMQQQLYLNTNNLESLTVADRSGFVLATTDPSITHVLDSDAYLQARGTLTAANSDVVMPRSGSRGYVEFSVPLRDDDGATWAILLGRADPARLWQPTLLASVDGSRNVIISGAGELAAGVPDAVLKQPWRGQPLERGGVRANIGGAESICGVSPIGQGSQIDRGTMVASCLPAALVGDEHARAIGRQGWITLSGAILALVLAAGVLHVSLRSPLPRLLLTGPSGEREPASAASESEPRAPSSASAALIEAYERRNERLAEQLREDVRARLLIVESEAGEAYGRASGDGDDGALHGHAMDELEAVRDRELRAIEQELYPAVVRLGLPNALKALRRDLAGEIDLTLEMDPLADAIDDEDAEREPVALGRRIVLYRLVLEGARALAAAGTREALVTLRRSDPSLSLSLEGAIDSSAGELDSAFAASDAAVVAYGGTLHLDRTAGSFRVTASFAAEPTRPAR